MTPKIRAHRILKHLEQYVDFERDGYPSYIVPDSRYIGVYENHAGSADDAVLVKLDGIELLNTGSSHIPFGAIANTSLPDSTKSEMNHILIADTRSGKLLKIPITGGNERTRDVFEFLRFLDRCLSDLAL